MKSFVLLLCLVQLWSCHSVPVGSGPGYREPACDDLETEQAALAAVDYINQNLRHGYKHTLNQIDKVRVWQRRPFGEVYHLELDTLETQCYARDPTPLANCSVRQVFEHAVEGDCEMQVLKQDGQFSVLFAKCHSTPDSQEDVRKVCPHCPLLALLNNTKVVHAAEAALAAVNAQSNGSYFKLLEISRGQLVPLPASTYVEFAVAATDCVAAAVTDPATCKLLAEKKHGFCKATLTEKLGGEEVAVTCTMFQTQPVAVQPQPDAAIPASPAPAADQAAPAPPAAGPPAAALVVGPMVAGVPLGPPRHQAHYDLRHFLSGVASVESASGEAFSPRKPPKGAQPGVAGSAGLVPPPCPGRIRHFKI
ncbi:alpha-2-HS-glycoprotein [Fukomys damarensis]|uniref:Alpha-2-HS-glycoprotein n=1 Tax=Fukomys damarensis TaxID=885580 RepID=A0A091ECZ1_FUKDA|nr:alpha-2-HS-glycoprotein [Fukomys damarensis]KFO33181.1 Alpha-2-HS-glycoprotein [Fukomys damarensis]